MNDISRKIRVSVQSQYIAQQSEPAQDHYVFAYTVTISNRGDVAANLLRRHWVITDAKGRTFEVKGEGVVGEQPYLKPGEDFEYTSGTRLDTPTGSMHGSYLMRTDEGLEFEVEIPTFILAKPKALH